MRMKTPDPAHESIGKDLVYENCRRLLRSPGGDGVDHAECLEEGVDHVDHKQEKRGGRKQWKHDCPETLPESCSINGCRLDDRLGMACRPARKNRKL